MTTDSSRSLSSIIDEGGLSAYQVAIIAMCSMIAMLDGFDTQSIAFVAPAIAAEWHMPVVSFGPIFSIGLLGGLIGALGFGALADRRGRKIALVLSVSVFALGALLTGWSRMAFELGALRFVTGLGLGGAMPSIISMTAEYAPRRARATLVTLMFCGFPLGAVIGAIGSTKLVPVFGWRSIFVAGGVLPLLLLPLLVFAMPESIRWLSARGRVDEITKILKHMRRAGEWDRLLPQCQASPQPRTAKVAGLFHDNRRAGTTLLWLTSFMSLLMVYLLVSWIPTIAQQTSAAHNVGVLAAAILNVTGIVGSLVFGRLSDRLGAFAVVSTAYIGGAVLVFTAALGTNLGSSIYWVAALAGFFCIGAQLCVVAIASGYYPLELRATGVGWTMGLGRFGAIVGPLAGGFLIRATASQNLLFGVVALISLIAGLAVYGMGKSAVQSHEDAITPTRS